MILRREFFQRATAAVAGFFAFRRATPIVRTGKSGPPIKPGDLVRLKDMSQSPGSFLFGTQVYAGPLYMDAFVAQRASTLMIVEAIDLEGGRAICNWFPGGDRTGWLINKCLVPADQLQVV